MKRKNRIHVSSIAASGGMFLKMDKGQARSQARSRLTSIGVRVLCRRHAGCRRSRDEEGEAGKSRGAAIGQNHRSVLAKICMSLAPRQYYTGARKTVYLS